MREDILKSYEYEKQEIDRWFTNASRDKITENKRNDAIECIFCIGKAYMLALILEKDFGEDTKEERLHMQKVKDYLQFDIWEKLAEG
ncbi:MAG: hypothetical protein NC416_01170 [Eubacterium sp.]|nr:hypothetical protein [Eubacterium sp.]